MGEQMEAILDSMRARCKLNEESERFLAMRRDQVGNFVNVDKEKYTASHTEMNKGLDFVFEGTVKEFFVPSLALPDGIPIDVFKPKGCPERPGIIINFHGGGMVYGSRKSCELICSVLSSELKCIVVNVEYRLAPDNKFPAMFDDAKCVTRWVLMNKSLLGGQHDSKVGVCGSSAGGGLAATVAFELPNLDFQILVYPLVDWRVDGGNHNDMTAEEKAMMKKLVDMTVQSPEDVNNVRASPVLQPNFARLPPTLILLAEADMFKESIQAFKCKVKAANVTCESRMMKGAVHGFFSLPGLFKETNRQCREIIARFFKKNGTY